MSAEAEFIKILYFRYSKISIQSTGNQAWRLCEPCRVGASYAFSLQAPKNGFSRAISSLPSVSFAMQEPVLRTVCCRTAFQEPDSNMIRVSLDCNVFMMREAGLQPQCSNWCCNEQYATVSHAEYVIW